MLTLVALAWLAASTAGVGAADRWFEDLTEKAGLAQPHRNRVFENQYANIMAGYTALRRVGEAT